MAQLLNTNFAVPKDPTSYVGTNTIVIKPKGVEKAFSVVDNANSIAAGLRTLGADLSTGAAITKLYPIPQQETALLLTVASTVVAETITWGVTYDLSSGFFDSADQPVLAFGIYFVSGVATTTLAQRTLTLKATDGAASTWGPSSLTPTTVVPEMQYILVDETNTTQDLTGANEAVVIPLDKLVSSAGKQFTFQLKFNLPASAVFVLYKVGLYRSSEDCSFIKPADIIIDYPKAFTDTNTPNQGIMKGGLGNYLGSKDRIGDNVMSFESDTYREEDMRKLSGSVRSSGGKEVSNEVELTIPSSYPYELSTGIPNLQAVTDVNDIWGKIIETTGQVKDINVQLGGNFVTQQTARFYQTGATKRLRFSQYDAGKTVRITTVSPNPDKIISKKLANSPTIYADVYRIIADTVDFNTSTKRKVLIYRNCTITVSRQSASIDNDATENMKFEIRSVSVSGRSVQYEEHYTL